MPQKFLQINNAIRNVMQQALNFPLSGKVTSYVTHLVRIDEQGQRIAADGTELDIIGLESMYLTRDLNPTNIHELQLAINQRYEADCIVARKRGWTVQICGTKKHFIQAGIYGNWKQGAYCFLRAHGYTV